tara:strand:- start:11878 stop:12114 length:237 start_codon:yes stop_codon:yes gene_type:complete
MIRFPKIELGFGKKELAKSTKGAAIAGVGAVAFSMLSGIGVLPDVLRGDEIAPYTVAALAVVVNLVRQFFTQHSSSEY